MLLQTNSYVVPRDKRAEHARILRRFRQALIRLGCDHFEVFEQVGANWSTADTSGRFVQIMRFRDRKHQMFVQAAERNDPTCQAVLREFCELINVPYQQQQGLFAVGFYSSFLRMPTQQPQQDNHRDQPEITDAAQASGATGMLSMSPEESAPADASEPAADSLPEDESPRGQYPEDHSTADHSGGIDLNAESTERTSDDSAESLSVDHEAYARMPEADLPESTDADLENHDVARESDTSVDADSELDASAQLNIEPDSEAENRSTPFNS